MFGVRLEDLVENVAPYVDEYERHATRLPPGSLFKFGARAVGKLSRLSKLLKTGEH